MFRNGKDKVCGVQDGTGGPPSGLDGPPTQASRGPALRATVGDPADCNPRPLLSGTQPTATHVPCVCLLQTLRQGPDREASSEMKFRPPHCLCSLKHNHNKQTSQVHRTQWPRPGLIRDRNRFSRSPDSQANVFFCNSTLADSLVQFGKT